MSKRNKKKKNHLNVQQDTMNQWRQIPIERRIWYCNTIFPKDASWQLRRSFIYDEEEIKEAEKFEEWIDLQTILPRKIALRMYKEIGIFNKNILILSKSKSKKIFKINKKWIIVFYPNTKRFYWYDVNGNVKDPRGERIVKRLNGYKKMAEIVEPILSEHEAINILERLQHLKQDKKMMENFVKYKEYLDKKDSLAAKCYYKDICKKLKQMFGERTYQTMILCESNVQALTNYLLSK